MKNNVLLEVKNLKKYFNLGRNQILKAVDDVSFTIRKGETIGVVGESGCGKTTCGRTVLGVYEPTGGEVLFDDVNIHKIKGPQKKQFSKDAQMIFQDPYSSLNPRMTVSDIIAEGIDAHRLYTGSARTEKVFELLHIVGLNKEHANRFPHEFSGGQRQRISIARSLAVEPKFIVCDEPIAALDVSIQAQIVNLLVNLQRNFDLTYLFIAHDLSMVKYISNRVMVMYLGCLAETAPSDELYKNPLHPYTKALMSAIPIPDPKVEAARNRIMLRGDVPSPINPEPGCRFKKRCPHARTKCEEQIPSLKEVSKDHFVSCHLY